MLFRDAVLTYCAALKSKGRFSVLGPPEALDLLQWMGVECGLSGEDGRSLVDPSRSQPKAESGRLADASGLPSQSLGSFRQEGFLGITMFSALVRSSYGPVEPGYFPTQLELSIYFDPSELHSGQARWDDEYLRECQSFFFEELTPVELLEEVYCRLPGALREKGKPFSATLQGLVFWLAQQSEDLPGLSSFFHRLLSPDNSVPKLRELLQRLERWEESALVTGWENLDPLAKEQVESKLLSDVPVEPASLLFACGPDLLQWRAS